ncbi:MAG TPA: DNA polymerase I, partial [Anaeromyxobacteraceae bacterium]|nr:DNA polymerase I [Anaeromyxobacteraceae bacterium]
APTHVAVVLDVSRRSFRTELDPTYKAQRPETPADLKPQLPLVREVTRALDVPLLEAEGFEADDVIATLAAHARGHGWEVVIVTGDKDFAQLVDGQVRLFDPMAEAKGQGGWTGPAEVEKKMGVPPGRVVEYQALLGDKVDNVPGVPGVGEVTASALVRHFGTVEAMLARPEEIPQAVKRGGEKLRDKIVAHADRLRLNRQLVTLKTDVRIPWEPEGLARRPVDHARARALFTELEFTRLLRDLPGDGAAPAGPAAGAGHTAAAEAPSQAAPPGGDPPAGPTHPRPEAPAVFADAAALRAAAAALAGAQALGLLVVGAGEAPRTDPVVGLALAGGGRAFYLPLGHRYLGAPAAPAAEEVRAALGPLLAGPAPVHAHDRKGAMHALARLGLELAAPGEDTGLLSRLLVPTRREHALGDVARERCRVELPPEPGVGERKGGPGKEGAEVERVAAWAAPAAAALPDLAAALLEAAGRAGLGRLYREVERPLVPVLRDMERDGIAVDKDAMAAMSAEFGAAMEDLEARMTAAAGHAFNVASTRELARVLFEELGLPVVKKLKTGPSTDVEVLERLAEQHPLPRLVLEHRSLSKLKGTYVDALPLLVDPADGRLHTTFHQAGAATGRLSSTDPNLQNIPVRTELSRRIRAAFVAPEGRRLVSADYSQIELRILAHYSGDPALLESFRTGEDVHTRTAAETYGVAPGEVTPEMRRVAKMLNFGIAYGLSAFGLSQRLDLPPKEGQAIIDRYFARYAGVKRWLGEIVASARRDGEVRTLFGRVRPMPEISARNPALRQGAERTAINTPIQGTAADLVKIAMLRVHAALARERLDARLLLQVHDELVVEAAERAVEPAAALLKREMEAVEGLSVPLVVEVGHGRSWAEAH